MTSEPFYRMCPNYDANSHKREMEMFRQDIQVALAGQGKGNSIRDYTSYRRTVTMNQSGQNDSRSPIKRISPDKRNKRPSQME